MAEDAKDLIELAIRRFIKEAPALQLNQARGRRRTAGRGDVQLFRLQMPELKVTKDAATDARVRVEMRREFFNVMAREAKVDDWDRGLHLRPGQGLGPRASLKLIVNVVERQQERQRARKARKPGPTGAIKHVDAPTRRSHRAACTSLGARLV